MSTTLEEGQPAGPGTFASGASEPTAVQCRAKKRAGGPTSAHRGAAAVVGLALGAAVLAGCGSDHETTTTTTTTTAASSTAPGAPGGPGGGPTDGGSATLIAGDGGYELAGGTATRSGVTYTTATANGSGVLVTDGGNLTLRRVTVRTTGSSSSMDNSSFYGQGAGVLATTAATVTITDSKVSTTGAGGNDVFASGSGTAIDLTGTTLTATGDAGHGIMASGGGTITAEDVTVTTTGIHGAPIATDRGGGTITVTGGSYTSSGADSPAIYSTGTIDVTGARLKATGSEAVVIEGANTATLKDATTSGAAKRGAMLYQSMSGDAAGTKSTLTIDGGSFSAAKGPLFYVTNASGTIHLTDVDLECASGVLLQAAADTWGTSGSNGGIATLVADGQELAGDVVVDATSTASLDLSDGSTLSGAIDHAGTASSVALTLDGTSSWTVTDDSHLTSLTGAKVSGGRVTNITGNGHTVTYESSSAPSLGGKTYQLTGGGTLEPA
jgi:hypothetical protein